MSRSRSVLLILLSVMLAYGCKKKDDNTDVTFVNRTGEDITLDIYSSFDDYALNANLHSRKVVKANENLIMPGNSFSSGRTYYMDWYSENYYRNNWLNDNYSNGNNRVAFLPESGNNTYYFEDSYQGKSRTAFLSNNKSATSWIAVGAYLYHSSTGYSNQWPGLNDNERFRKITVNKNFTANYQFKDNSGAEQSQTISFLVQQSVVPYIEFKAEDGRILGNMTGGKLPTASPPDYESTSTDTVTALFPNSDYIFLMVKQ